MSTTLPWHPLLLRPSAKSHGFISNNRLTLSKRHVSTTVLAFQRSDFDRFAKRVASGEAWKEGWRNANDGFEQLLFDAKKAAERFDREYSVSKRVGSLKDSAFYQARVIDRELEISRRWRTFSGDFSRNLPAYRKQVNGFLDTPLGRSFATIFFLWFALSGWLFRFLILATWVLPIAAPLLIGTLANNFVIQGQCPACKKPFVGAKNQVVSCSSCGNIVWQPKGDFSGGAGGARGPKRDFFNRGGRGTSRDPDIIDVDFEEK